MFDAVAEQRELDAWGYPTNPDAYPLSPEDPRARDPELLELERRSSTRLASPSPRREGHRAEQPAVVVEMEMLLQPLLPPGLDSSPLPPAIPIRKIVGQSAPANRVRPEISDEPDGIGQIQQQAVIGSDNRQRVKDVHELPYSATLSLFSYYSSGGQSWLSRCSGALVSSRLALTSAHCIYKPEQGGYAKSIRVVAGRDGDYMPFGDAYVIAATKEGAYVDEDSRDNDFAYLMLSRPIGDYAGHFDVPTEALPNSAYTQDVWTVSGYPAEVGESFPDEDRGTRLWRGTGSICSTSTNRLRYQSIDTTGGQSGGPLHLAGTMGWGALGGIHRGTTTVVVSGCNIHPVELVNDAVRLTQPRLDWIKIYIPYADALAANVQDYTGWTSVGGSYGKVAPTLTVRSGPNYDFFHTGNWSGKVYWNYWDWNSLSWSGLQDLSPGGAPTSQKRVAAHAVGDRVYLAIQGENNRLHVGHLWLGFWGWGDFSGWTQLSGYLTSAPTFVPVSTNRFFVVGDSLNGYPRYWEYNSGSWSGPVNLGTTSGEINKFNGDFTTAIEPSTGKVQVFGWRRDNRLCRWRMPANGWSSYGWVCFNPVGWRLAGRPTATAVQNLSAGEVFVYAPSDDGRVWFWKKWPDGGWGGPWDRSNGGFFGKSLNAVSRAPGKIDLLGVVARPTPNWGIEFPMSTGWQDQPNNELYHRPYDSGWGGWQSLGGHMIDMDVHAQDSNSIAIVARGSDRMYRIRTLWP